METPENSSAEIPLIEMIDAAIAPAQFDSAIEVERINWRVMPKDFWVVGGFHGSGKSDLLATVAGLQRPARGLVKIFGHETFTIEEEMLVEHRRRIGMVFSNGGRLFNRLTVAENAALPLRYHRNLTEAETEAAVREVLEFTGLISMAHKIPSALSINWKQRAALARALILKPEILLLDSPFLGLDFRQQQWWLDFLKSLSEGSAYYGGKLITIVATSDNLESWKSAARQFAILKNKLWREIGGRAELEASGELLLDEVWADES